MSSVPDDITREILVRLPVRSLARYRSVCKEWNSIISNPDFVAAHLDRARKSLPPSIVAIEFKGRCYSTTLDNAHDLRRISTKRLPIHRSDRPTISGCGLLCIARSRGSNSIHLLNPATGESLTLPDPPDTAVAPILGFHPVTKQYKVINVYENFKFGSTLELVFNIYTVGSGSWRTRENLDFWPTGIRRGVVCINGTIYWTTKHKSSLGDCIIASFDLATESSTKISFPCVYGDKTEEIFILGTLLELEGSLAIAVLIFEEGSEKMDVWVLAGGQKHEWIKKCSLSIPWNKYVTRPISAFDGKMLMESQYERDTVLSFIDLRSGIWKRIYTHRDTAHFFPFVESLTSPKNILGCHL